MNNYIDAYEKDDEISGIFLYYSYGNVIFNNTIQDAGKGIYLQSASSNELKFNKIGDYAGNTFGIYISGSPGAS